MSLERERERCVNGRMVSILILEKYEESMENGLYWNTIGSNGQLL